MAREILPRPRNGRDKTRRSNGMTRAACDKIWWLEVSAREIGNKTTKEDEGSARFPDRIPLEE
jgi:hypothetical protein